MYLQGTFTLDAHFLWLNIKDLHDQNLDQYRLCEVPESMVGVCNYPKFWLEFMELLHYESPMYPPE